MPDSGFCPEFDKLQASHWRTHIFLNGSNYTPTIDGVDVTLVAHFTIEELPSIAKLSIHWKGKTVTFYTDHYKTLTSVNIFGTVYCRYNFLLQCIIFYFHYF